MHAPGHVYWQAHNADVITDMPLWASSRSLYQSCNVHVAYITFLMLNPGWLAHVTILDPYLEECTLPCRQTYMRFTRVFNCGCTSSSPDESN